MKGLEMIKASMLSTLLLTSLAGAAVAQTIDAKVALSSVRLLPGVPFDVPVVLRNVSRDPLNTHCQAVVLIASANATSKKSASGGLAFGDEADADLDPGASKTGVIQWHSNLFFEDADVTGPGDYTISVDLIDVRSKDEDGSVAVGRFTTPAVRFTRIVPQGEDAAVWEKMQAAANGRWPSLGFIARGVAPGIADDVIRNHKTSNYYPYALLIGNWMGGFKQLTLATLDDAIARFPSSPVLPRLLGAAAVIARHEAAAAVGDDAVKALYERSVEYAKKALSTGDAGVAADATYIRRASEADVSRLSRRK